MSDSFQRSVVVPKIAVLWQSYGPYHITRLEALVQVAGRDRVVGIEISSKTSTYSWRRALPQSLRLISLFDRVPAEKVGGLRVYAKIKGVLLREKVQVLFVPSYWPFYSFASFIAAKRLGLKVVVMNESHLRSGRNSLASLAIKQMIVRRFDAGFVGGSVHRSFFRQLGMRNERIVEGYDIVDNEVFSARADEARKHEESWRIKLGLPRRYVLSLGRFVKKKNLGLVVEAFAIARAQGRANGHDLIFVGDGPEKTNIVAIASRCGLPIVEYSDAEKIISQSSGTEVVRIYPFAQLDTSPVFYALASCFVLASKVEEWGLVVNEAMASGCPVLVSREAGCAPDLVIPDVTGHRFDPENVNELAWRLGLICCDDGVRKDMGDSARRHIASWSREKFGSSALRAAEIALLPKNIALTSASELQPYQARVRLLQTCFPDYREQVFDEINRRLGERFELYSGREYFTRDVVICREFKPWHYQVNNSFFLASTFLWQHGVVGAMCSSDVTVLELNPRILSSWIILSYRRFLGRRTLLWGHAWARQGITARTNAIRLLMMRLSSGVIPYSHTQKRQLKQLLPNRRIWVAPNSLVRRASCRVGSAKVDTKRDIIFVGRLNRGKKVGLLLDAFIKASEQLPSDVRLVYLGTGEDERFLRKRASNCRFPARIVFQGHVNDEEMLLAAYDKAFCAVSPGYVGLSAIQSFAHGVPMIVADREMHSPEIEACQEGFNCSYFRSNDHVSLANAIVSMWQEREKWFERRMEISGWLADNYSVEVMVDGFMEALSGN